MSQITSLYMRARSHMDFEGPRRHSPRGEGKQAVESADLQVRIETPEINWGVGGINGM